MRFERQRGVVGLDSGRSTNRYITQYEFADYDALRLDSTQPGGSISLGDSWERAEPRNGCAGPGPGRRAARRARGNADAGYTRAKAVFRLRDCLGCKFAEAAIAR
jgi:hypothetical protein